jgi:hypothetical protein
MSDRRPPSFDELVDPDDPDRARLLAAHDLLTAAGAPPELPPSLEEAPPEPKSGSVITFPRRRYTAIAAVAVAAIVLLGVGFAIGNRNSPDEAVQTIAMKGPGGATASIALLPADEAGNWPMRLEVSGLPALPAGKTYTLWLRHDGKLAESCGAFKVSSGTTKVPLNAPYRLKNFDDWVIVRTGTTTPLVASTTI